MKRLTNTAGCWILALACASVPGLAQEPASVDTSVQMAAHQDSAATTLERRSGELAALTARIAETEARYQVAAGEDRDLYYDQLRRRWREHHELLDRLATEIESAREAGEERPEITGQVRAALGREIEVIYTWLTTVPDSIGALRSIASETPLPERLELEIELSGLNDAHDRLLESLVEDFAHSAALGMPVAAEQTVALDSALTERAQYLAAQVERALDLQSDLEDRRLKPGGDTVTINAGLAVLEERILGRTTSLQAMVGLMGSREMETSEFRQLLLRATGDLGTEILDPEVVGGLISDWWMAVLQWFEDNGGTIVVQLLTILVVLLFAALFARLGRRAMKRLLSSRRINVSELLKNLALGATSKLIWIVGILVALSVIGIDIGPMLAGLGIAGFILGFALQDTLSNFAAGLMIMIYSPFDVGDLVTAGGVFGTVQDLTLVSTVITTIDNQRIVVPNGKVWGDVINNATAERIRRVDLVFGIGYEDDIDKARGILEQIVAQNELVLDDPDPVVRVHTLGESSVDFVCRPWCRTQDYWDVYWEITEEVKKRFDAEGVSIPFPQRDVHVHTAGDQRESDTPENPGT